MACSLAASTCVARSRANLAEGHQFACVSLIRGFQGLALGLDVPQLQILVSGRTAPAQAGYCAG